MLLQLVNIVELSRDFNFLTKTISKKTHNNLKFQSFLFSFTFLTTKQQEHVKSNHQNPTFHQALHIQTISPKCAPLKINLVTKNQKKKNDSNNHTKNCVVADSQISKLQAPLAPSSEAKDL